MNKVSTSPFKYLNSFQNTEKDNDEFVGRKKEGVALRKLFQRSPLIIIHGPSGSGKTSLLNCELFQQNQISEQSIYRPRFHQKMGFLEVISTLLIDRGWPKAVGEIIPKVTNLRQQQLALANNPDFQKLKEDLNHFQSEINDLRHKSSSTIVRIREDLETSVVSIQEKLADNNRIEEAIAQELSSLGKSLKAAFIQDLRKTGTTPIILFDQFEEYFALRSVKTKKYNYNINEVNSIGIFIKFVLDQNIPANIIFSFRDEYLGEFDQLKNYLPNIYSSKLRVARPKEELCKVIMRELFQKFNIQFNEKIFDSIIGKIKFDGKDHRLHLPFLQVFLDKLYQTTLKRLGKTYDEKEPLPRLTITEADVEDTGNVIDIIQELILSSENSLDEQKELKKNKAISNLLKKDNHVILRFLKKFVSPDQTKVTYFYSELKSPKENALADYEFHGDVDIQTEVSLNPSENQLLTSKIITILGQNRIINIDTSKKIIELSHDTLARIISNLSLDLDFYKEKFELEYKLYKKENEARKRLIQSIDIENFKGHMEYVNPLAIKSKEDTDEEFLEAKKNHSDKQKFWERSLRRYRVRKNLTSYGILAAFFSLILGINYFQDQSIKNNLTNDINASLFKKRSNPTEAYFILEKYDAENYNGEAQSILEGMHWDFKKEPFYKEELKFPKDNGILEHIVSVKKMASNKDEENIFVQIPGKLYHYALHKNGLTLDSIPLFTFDKDSIQVFEPFLNEQNDLNILILTDKDFWLVQNNGKETKKITSANILGLNSCVDIEYMGQGNFVLLGNKSTPANDKNSIPTLITINVDRAGQIEKMNEVSNDLIYLKRRSLQKYNNSILVIKGWPEKNRTQITSNLLTYKIGDKVVNSRKIEYPNYTTNWEDINALGKSDTSLYIVKDDLVIRAYLNSKNEIITNKKTLIYSRIPEKFGSIDVAGKTFAIGGLGQSSEAAIMDLRKLRTADPNEQRTFRAYRKSLLKGHQGSIERIFFLFDSDKYVMTQSQDNTIKIWDLSPFNSSEYSITGAQNITQLAFHEDQVYASYIFYDPNKSNRIYKLNPALDNQSASEIIANFQGNTLINSFGFHEEFPILSTQHHQTVTLPGDQSIAHHDFNETIFDLKVANGKLAVATRRGVYFGNIIRNNIDGDQKNKLNEKNKFLNEKGSENFNNKLRPTLTLTNIKSTLDSLSIQSVAIHPTANNFVAVGGDDGEIFLWNGKNNNLDTIGFALEKILDLRFSNDGKYLFSGSANGKLNIYENSSSDPSKYAFKQTIFHSGKVESIAFFNDEKLATAGRNKKVRVFNFPSSEGGNFDEQQVYIDSEYSFTAVVFGNNKNSIYTGDITGTIKHWELTEIIKDIKGRICDYCFDKELQGVNQ